mmetsp:Transcript_4476/g.14349  ORF Transcript_4476/g.14349 Transcript_4476/m.14349 type:complete len:380 (+) Transcript_4476:121-1260(+)
MRGRPHGKRIGEPPRRKRRSDRRSPEVARDGLHHRVHRRLALAEVPVAQPRALGAGAQARRDLLDARRRALAAPRELRPRIHLGTRDQGALLPAEDHDGTGQLVVLGWGDAVRLLHQHVGPDDRQVHLLHVRVVEDHVRAALLLQDLLIGLVGGVLGQPPVRPHSPLAPVPARVLGRGNHHAIRCEAFLGEEHRRLVREDAAEGEAKQHRRHRRPRLLDGLRGCTSNVLRVRRVWLLHASAAARVPNLADLPCLWRADLAQHLRPLCEVVRRARAAAVAGPGEDHQAHPRLRGGLADGAHPRSGLFERSTFSGPSSKSRLVPQRPFGRVCRRSRLLVWHKQVFCLKLKAYPSSLRTGARGQLIVKTLPNQLQLLHDCSC